MQNKENYCGLQGSIWAQIREIVVHTSSIWSQTREIVVYTIFEYRLERYWPILAQTREIVAYTSSISAD